MRITCLIVLCLYFSVKVPGQSSTVSPETIKTITGREIDVMALDRFLEQQMDSSAIPGLSIAIINNSRIVYHRALGVANIQTAEPVNNHTLFEAVS